MDRNLLRQRLQRVRIAPGGDSHQHLLESPFIQRIARTSCPSARQTQFATIHAASPPTLDLDPSAAQDQRTRGVTCAQRWSNWLTRIARTA